MVNYYILRRPCHDERLQDRLINYIKIYIFIWTFLPKLRVDLLLA